MSLPAGEIPTSLYGRNGESLIQFMTEHRSDWSEIFLRLKGQVGRAKALKLTEKAESEILHEEEVIRLRVNLHGNVTEALERIGNALRSLYRLGSGPTCDEEYTGQLAKNLGSLLTDAQRNLSVARTLMPTNAKGDMC